MAPTEGRVAKPEPRWGCRRGRPTPIYEISACDIWLNTTYTVAEQPEIYCLRHYDI